MTFESAQTNFHGQQGWNDLAPDALKIAQAAKNNKGKVRPRRAVSAIPPALTHLADSLETTASEAARPSLATQTPLKPLAGPPKVSQTESSKAPPITPPQAAGPPKATQGPYSSAALAESPSHEKDVSVEEVKESLITLSERPSNLGKPEIDATLQKVEAHFCQLSHQQCALLKEALSFAPCEKTRARKLLVDYSLIHSNVSQWTVPIRMLIDQQQ